jgi:hypothetical protein
MESRTPWGVFGGATPGAQQSALDAMRHYRFDTMGSSRTYWDFFLGYGLFLSVNFLLQAILFWLLGSMVETKVGRGIVLTFGLGYLAFAALAWRYFFAGPVVFELLIAGCLLGAYAAAGGIKRDDTT